MDILTCHTGKYASWRASSYFIHEVAAKKRINASSELGDFFALKLYLDIYAHAVRKEVNCSKWQEKRKLLLSLKLPSLLTALQSRLKFYLMFLCIYRISEFTNWDYSKHFDFGLHPGENCGILKVGAEGMWKAAWNFGKE